MFWSLEFPAIGGWGREARADFSGSPSSEASDGQGTEHTEHATINIKKYKRGKEIILCDNYNKLETAGRQAKNKLQKKHKPQNPNGTSNFICFYIFDCC